MSLLTIPDKTGCDELRRTLEDRKIAYDEIDFMASKNLEYDLFRLFFDNQRYAANFTVGDPDIDPNGIEAAIQAAMKQPERLAGPFLLREGRILGRADLRKEFGLAIPPSGADL